MAFDGSLKDVKSREEVLGLKSLFSANYLDLAWFSVWFKVMGSRFSCNPEKRILFGENYCHTRFI